MKRYLLFGYNDYYPRGADRDYIDDFDTIEEMEKFYMQQKYKFERTVYLDTQQEGWFESLDYLKDDE